MSNKDWFVSWFDTPYYHKLYKHRDDVEAQKFMDKLVAYLNVAEGASILDLACGKGRHSIYLNGLGYHVTGLDLSEQSIEYAKQFENEHLQFKVHDMRKNMSENYDIVFNLFTSFGYFETVDEDVEVLTNIKNAVNEYGIAVIDYLNYPLYKKI
jgi:2-polyprenyl-3-methyl-5-hydroxy-6-metoxy-1,4-benzoquinol methylase